MTVIVSTTLKDIQNLVGSAVTGGGSLLPNRDLIRLAAHANHYLAIFDDSDGRPLYLGRSCRIARYNPMRMVRGRNMPTLQSRGHPL